MWHFNPPLKHPSAEQVRLHLISTVGCLVYFCITYTIESRLHTWNLEKPWKILQENKILAGYTPIHMQFFHLFISYYDGILDVVFVKKVPLRTSAWSGKSLNHHHLPRETGAHTAEINNGRRIPTDNKGESLLCARVCVCQPMCTRVTIPYHHGHPSQQGAE